MANVIKRDIEATFTRILEEWGMMIVDEHLPWQGIHEIFGEHGKVLVAKVKFKGPLSGTYSIACQEGFARNLLCNVLGDPDEVDDNGERDCLCELVNVLSGNLLTTCYGEETVFALEAPVCAEVDLDVAKDKFGERGFVCIADGEPVALTFYVKEGL